MKTTFLLLAAATTAFASCTNSEVMEVAGNRTISFAPFVEKATKTATEIVGVNAANGLTKFYVFGKYGDNSEGTYDTEVFSNLEVNVTGASDTPGTGHYWIAGKYYKFAAYSDGNKQIASGVSFGNDGNITISDYTVSNKDLILVTSTNEYNGSSQIATNTPVALTFSHLLSQLSFEFTNGFTAQGYTLEISGLSFTVENQATYTSSDGNWNIATGNPVTNRQTGNVYTDEAWFVIPQSNATSTGYKVSFTATVKDRNNTVATKSLTAHLATGDHSSDNNGNAGNDTWIKGYKYKYTATIDAGTMGITDNEIKFQVSVAPWKDAGDTTISPSNNRP